MVAGSDEDDYTYDDDGFDGYIENSIDPGPWMLLGTTLYCLATIIALPMLVVWDQKRQRHKRMRETALFACEQQEAGYHDNTVQQEQEQQEQAVVRKDSREHLDHHHHHPHYDQCSSQQSKSVTFSPQQQDSTIGRTRSSAASDHSGADNNNSVVERGLAKLASVTRYVNQAIDQVSHDNAHNHNRNHHIHNAAQGSTVHAARSEVSAGSRVSLGSRSIRSNTSSRSNASSFMRIKPFQRRSKSRISSRSAAMHKKMYNEGREDDVRHFSSSTSQVSASEKSAKVELVMRYDQRYGNNSNANRQQQRLSFVAPSNSGMSHSFMSGAGSQYGISTLAPDDAVDANDPGKGDFLNTSLEDEVDYDVCCCGTNPSIWNPALIVRGMSTIVDLAEYDNESKRLIKLAVPMTISEVLDKVFDNVQLALIARNISTDAVAAFAISGLFIELTDTFIKGIPDAENTVCSHAIGCRNFFLAGQYVQIAAVLYVAFSIPLLGVWYYVMDDAILWLGLNQRIAKMGADYTRIAIIPVGLEGIAEALLAVLDITDHEDFVACFWVGSAFLQTAAIAFFTIYYDGGQGRYRVATLIHLGCSCFITLPLAALFTYVFNFNLEGRRRRCRIFYCWHAHGILHIDQRLGKNIYYFTRIECNGG